ncbi:MAG: bifunctional diaminohydroxyphosphoribosylaminopyrimidine deaminase/5-amino-6-(5-phosphoribosylamino)uracil reductase RibD [Candidatus Neomarinimicrobiota bacterium]
MSLRSTSNFKTDKDFMLEAIKLASQANSDVYPNPKVGCLIVQNNKILSQSNTSKYGSHHAEKNALRSIDEHEKNLTMYVTMEPCHHYGKTPPCTDLIKYKQFDRVVIAETDPSATAGGGAEFLKENNIKVDIGICSKEARELNPKFYTFHEKKRPYVVLKYASSLDGYIALKNGKSKWITSQESRSSNHEVRSECDAILVGRKTVEMDNPNLTSHGKGKDPRIILIDRDQKIDRKSNIFKGVQEVIVFDREQIGEGQINNVEYILKRLYEMNIQSLLVEGGGITITSFLKSGIFDEINAYVAPKFFGQGIPLFQDIGSLENIHKLRLDRIKKLGNDIQIIYKRKN